MEDDVDELTDSDFSKSTARLCDEINIGKDGVIPLSKYVDLIEALGDDFHSE